MGELVLLVLGATWAAVLIPPLLRNRIENRPNSSVTDFRRQLNKLQSTVPSRASGSMRGMARPLAQSPLHRPVAGGRPGLPAGGPRRSGTRSHADRTPERGTTLTPARETAPRKRSHGTNGHGTNGGNGDGAGVPRRSTQHRQAHVARHAMSSTDAVRRRRSNVLFLLVLATGSTLFLAATTQAAAMLYLFAFSFLALCGYVYMLSQMRQRENTSWPNDWMHR
jgi:hypothetical protein